MSNNIDLENSDEKTVFKSLVEVMSNYLPASKKLKCFPNNVEEYVRLNQPDAYEQYLNSIRRLDKTIHSMEIREPQKEYVSEPVRKAFKLEKVKDISLIGIKGKIIIACIIMPTEL